MKLGSGMLEGSEVWEGREMRPEPDFEVVILEVLLRMEGRFLGTVGAWVVLAWFLKNIMRHVGITMMIKVSGGGKRVYLTPAVGNWVVVRSARFGVRLWKL